MQDPVRLPGDGEGIILDRSTIKQHITLNGETNPFNNMKMTMNDLIEMPELKKEINAWIRGKLKAKGMSGNQAAFGEQMMDEEIDDFNEDAENDENSNTNTDFFRTLG